VAADVIKMKKNYQAFKNAMKKEIDSVL